MRDSVQLLRQHIKSKGWKHWRVTSSGWRGHQRPYGVDVTAFKTSPVVNVQYTLRGEALAVSFAIDQIEAGEIK